MSKFRENRSGLSSDKGRGHRNGVTNPDPTAECPNPFSDVHQVRPIAPFHNASGDFDRREMCQSIKNTEEALLEANKRNAFNQAELRDLRRDHNNLVRAMIVMDEELRALKSKR